MTEFIQLAIVFDGTVGSQRWELYANGSLVASDAAPTDTSAGGSNSIGLGNDVGGGFNVGLNASNFEGDLAGIRFYNSALSAQQISDSYDAFVPEPSSMTLIGLGTLVLAARRRRDA